MAARDSYLVIGGCGFLGWTIVQALLARGERAVAAFDIAQRQTDARVRFFVGDMCERAIVEDAIRQCKATCIIHTASPVHGSPQAIYERVNVSGTQSIVDAAVACGVPKLVFTSSASVVFDGSDIVGVDERLPVTDAPIDEYVRTKIEAERIVLAANGTGALRTVALRPALIFGPGDRQFVPPLITILRSGRSRYQIGNNENLFDMTYVDNVAKAHLLAADRLGDDEKRAESIDVDTPLEPIALTLTAPPLPTSAALDGSAACPPRAIRRHRFDQFAPNALEEEDGATTRVAGSAFFITNGEPLPFWTLMRAVWRAWGDGYDPARSPIVLPRPVALALAAAGEWACWALGREPTFTRFRVMFSCVNRWYNIEKARRVLGYEPDVGVEEGVRRTVEWLKQKELETPGYIH